MSPTMSILLITCLSLGMLGETAAGPDSVKIESSVLGRTITWKVINVSGPPIIAVEIPAVAVYHPTAPTGWICDESAKGLKAGTKDSSSALLAGKSAVFSVKGTSTGTILSDGSAQVEFGDGRVLEVTGIMTFGPEQTGTIMFVPLVLFGMVAVHLLLARRRRVSIK